MRQLGLIVSLFALAACRSSSIGWASGEHFVLHDTDELQVRASTSVIEPDGEHVFLHWAGARSTPGSPTIDEFMLVVFDDVNGNNFPDDGEVLASKTSFESTTKVLVSSVRVPLVDRIERLKGWAQARTRDGIGGGLWRLLVD